MRHGFTNSTERVADTVRKTYDGPDAAQRQSKELLALTALAGEVPVPKVTGYEAGSLSMTFMAGEHGQDLIDRGHAARVLEGCGRVLHTLHSIDVTKVYARNGAFGLVVTHGDFGPNNVLLDPSSFDVTAVLDWEFSGPGHAIIDVAWCEWIVRMHHADAVAVLGAFFAAYGYEPPWGERQAAMVRRCHWLETFAKKWDPEGPAVAEWQKRAITAARWAEYPAPPAARTTS